jgi:hypothetical protein
LNSHVNSWHLEFFEEDLKHFLSVFGGIHVGFGQEDGALVGGYLQKGEGVFPEELHVIPIINDAVGDGVLELIEPALIRVELLSNVGLQLVRCVRNDHLVLRPADSRSGEVYREGKT